MEIAVAAPHGARPRAAGHQLDERLQRSGQRHGKRLADRRIQAIALLAELADVGGHRAPVVVGAGET